jgi:hypothetical protein
MISLDLELKVYMMDQHLVQTQRHSATGSLLLGGMAGERAHTASHVEKKQYG